MTDHRAQRHILVVMAAVVGLLHLAGIVVLSREPALAGVGIVAYLLGIRHACDARHVAVISRFSRSPSAALWFSLGSATTVFSVTFLLAMIVRPSASATPAGVFLAILGALNLVVLIGALTGRSATLYGLRGRLSRWVRHPWQLFPLGVIVGFGLLITAETGLLLLAATAAVPDLPLAAIITQPLLFAAGLCLVGAVQGVRMSTPTAGPPAAIAFTTIAAAGTLAIAAIDLAGIDLTPAAAPDLTGFPLAAILLLVLAIPAFLAFRRYRHRPVGPALSGPPAAPFAPPAAPFTSPAAPFAQSAALFAPWGPQASTPPVVPPSASPVVPPSAPPSAPPVAQASVPPVVPPSASPVGAPSAPPSAPPVAQASVPPVVPPSASPVGTPSAPPSAPPVGTPSASPVVPPSAPPSAPPVAQASVPPVGTPSASPVVPPSSPPVVPPLAATHAQHSAAALEKPAGPRAVPDSDRAQASAPRVVPVSDRAVMDGRAVVAPRLGTGSDHGRGVARVAGRSGHPSEQAAAGDRHPTAAERPGVEGAVAERPGVEGAVAERPGVEGAVAERPGVEGAAAERPGVEGTVAERPGVEGTVGERPGVEGAAVAERPGVEGTVGERSGGEGAAGRRAVAEGAAGGELAGGVAVVTGAGAGLGRAMALGLAASGYGVVAVDLDAESAEACATQALAYGVAARAMAADVRDPRFLERIVAAAGELGASGGPTVLVNSVAGWVAERYPDSEAWVPPTLDLTDATLLSQLVLEPMRSRGGGAIVNVIAGGAGTDQEARLIRFTATFAPVARRFDVRAMCVTADRLIVPATDVLAAVLDLIHRGDPGAIVELRGSRAARLDTGGAAGRSGSGGWVGRSGGGNGEGRSGSGGWVGRSGGSDGEGRSGSGGWAGRSGGGGRVGVRALFARR